MPPFAPRRRCVCLLAVGAARPAEQAPMTFRVGQPRLERLRRRLPAGHRRRRRDRGGDAAGLRRFRQAGSQSPRLRSVIFMNSPGGNVVASMELGADFRRLRAAVIVAGFASVGSRSGPVAGQCLSACVYALMGATQRVAPPESQHRPAPDVDSEASRARAGGATSPTAGWSRPRPLRGADGRQSRRSSGAPNR